MDIKSSNVVEQRCSSVDDPKCSIANKWKCKKIGQARPGASLSLFCFCKTPVLAKSKRLGVDFVFPLSQWQSQSQQPHQNLEVPGKLEAWTFVWKLI